MAKQNIFLADGVAPPPPAKIDPSSTDALAHDKRVRGATSHVADTPEVGFAVCTEAKFKPRLDRTEKAALTCSHCHKSGHGIATCFDIHGIPDWYLENYESSLKAKASAPSIKRQAVNVLVRAHATAPDVNSGASLAQPSPAQPSPASAAQLLSSFTAINGLP